MSPRWRLILAAAAFLGWMAYLGYAAAVKSHAPIVSHAQAAAARVWVVAEVMPGADGKASPVATVAEVLSEGAPAAGTELFVSNLPEAKFGGSGQYLLLLVPDPAIKMPRADGPPRPAFQVVEQQRSPGSELAGAGTPLIYPWTDDVRKQAERLLPAGKNGP